MSESGTKSICGKSAHIAELWAMDEKVSQLKDPERECKRTSRNQLLSLLLHHPTRDQLLDRLDADLLKPLVGIRSAVRDRVVERVLADADVEEGRAEPANGGRDVSDGCRWRVLVGVHMASLERGYALRSVISELTCSVSDL
jgi:hypothetical protein